MRSEPHNERPSSCVPLGRLALCAMLFIGPPLPAAAQPTGGAPRQYRVQRGDTLRLIARRFYGAKRHWFRIYQANRAVIGGNPSLILVGAVFTIPSSPQAAMSTPPKVLTAVPTPPKVPQPGPTWEPSSALPIAKIAPPPEPPLATLVPTRDPRDVATISLHVTEPRVSPYLPAAASLIVPGSAQMARGEWDRGLTHLSLTGLALGATLVGRQNADPSLQWTGSLTLLGISLWSAWDAYHHGQAVMPL